MNPLLVLGCACWIGSANAVLYPVRPVANSVFSGGSQNKISWIEEGNKPSLAEMGLVSLDLYIDRPNAKYLMNLAQNVDAKKLSQDVFIPHSIWTNSSTFFILFTSNDTKPPTTIYTADFTITGLTGTADNDHDGRASLSVNSSAALSGAHSSNLNNGKSSPSTSGMNITLATLVTSAGSGSATATLSTTAPKFNTAPSSGRRQLNSHSKYNLLFVMWPALFGLAMAL